MQVFKFVLRLLTLAKAQAAAEGSPMQCQPENNLTTKPTKFPKQLDLKILKDFYLEVILLGEGLVQPAAEILQCIFLHYLLFEQKC